MNNGHRVLQWAQQNGHTVTWMADQLGYSRQRLSVALHQNDISFSLCNALYERFRIRITPLRDLSKLGKAKRRKGRQKPILGRGRTPGAGRGARASKLDPHVDEITGLLAEGATYREIAKRFGTTPSNLHDWLKKRGLK
ncbi:hypothetical protein [Candidatus Entotheonella palauensis]|uniref:hypothetical protein n=1 Tax=Candidatus Entotheonella palauensis TaxID=93172 RepID=UPI000B7D70A0|nr:hypothetical protein [Candidatus Entotheonella palauensis]